MNYVSPVNTGTIARRAEGSKARGKAAERTLIVTGLARSGTSMLAAVLRRAGVFMGEQLYETVDEDAQMLAVLRSGSDWLLRALIERRNLDNRVWGFKLPDLHTMLTAERVAWFRNPRLVVVLRDPVAVAVRGALSERQDEFRDMMGICGGMGAIARFAEAAECPALLVSYEKALAFPERTVATLLDFCGVERGGATLPELAEAVRPNSPDYLASANRQFAGNIDGVVSGHLSGWCHRVGSLQPVTLELSAGGKTVAEFSADVFRDDLVASGIGNGNHGFFVDLSRLRLRPATELRVKVAGRTFELDGSGKKLKEYPVLAAEPRWDALATALGPAFARATAPILARAR